MRHTLFSIYNKVALDIKDPTFNKITKQQYLTAAGEIALDISKESHMFVQQRKYVANGGETTLIIHSSHSLMADFRQLRMEFEPQRVHSDFNLELLRRGKYEGTGMYDTTTGRSEYSRVLNDFVWNYDLTMLVYNLDALLPFGNKKIPNDTMFKPLYILKTMRGQMQLEEHSYDAIHSALFHNRSFNNDDRLGRKHYAIRKLNADSAYYAERANQYQNKIVNTYVPVFNEEDQCWYQDPKFDPEQQLPIMQWTPPDDQWPIGTWVFTDDHVTTGTNPGPTIYDIRRMHYPRTTELTSLSESMVLFFAIPLEKDEEITIDFVTQMPIHSELHMAYSGPTVPHDHPSFAMVDSDGNQMLGREEEVKAFMNGGAYSIDEDLSTQSNSLWVSFEDNTVIPDLLETSFYKGIRWAIVEKLFMQEGDLWGSRLAVAKREYEAELVKLRSYQRNKKDISSVLRVQAYKFLEGEW